MEKESLILSVNQEGKIKIGFCSPNKDVIRLESFIESSWKKSGEVRVSREKKEIISAANPAEGDLYAIVSESGECMSVKIDF